MFSGGGGVALVGTQPHATARAGIDGAGKASPGLPSVRSLPANGRRTTPSTAGSGRPRPTPRPWTCRSCSRRTVTGSSQVAIRLDAFPSPPGVLDTDFTTLGVPNTSLGLRGRCTRLSGGRRLRYVGMEDLQPSAPSPREQCDIVVSTRKFVSVLLTAGSPQRILTRPQGVGSSRGISYAAGTLSGSALARGRHRVGGRRRGKFEGRPVVARALRPDDALI